MLLQELRRAPFGAQFGGDLTAGLHEMIEREAHHMEAVSNHQGAWKVAPGTRLGIALR